MSEIRDNRQAAFELRIANRLEELERLHEFLSGVAEREEWPKKLELDFLLCCEELLTNTILYGYPQGGEHTIRIATATENGVVNIVLEDEGIAFDPLTDSDAPDITLGVEERKIGGLGIYFVQRLMDKLQYERTAQGYNRMVLAKALNSNPQGEER